MSNLGFSPLLPSIRGAFHISFAQMGLCPHRCAGAPLARHRARAPMAAAKLGATPLPRCPQPSPRRVFESGWVHFEPAQ